MSTGNQLATVEYQEAGITKASLAHTQNQLALLEEFVRDVLRPHQDFGVIPGTDKPTLLKPGAANVIAAFNCHSEPHVDVEQVDSDHQFANYTVHVDVVSNQTGNVVARGFGSCNSYEKKYRYREEQRECPKCHAPAIIRGKEEWGGGWLCWKRKSGCGAKFNDGDQAIEGQTTGTVDNPDPLDQSNTYLKMAIKRAAVDAALRLPGVARFFTQDLEDIMGRPSEETAEGSAPQPTGQQRAKGRRSTGTSAKKTTTTPEGEAPENGSGGHQDYTAVLEEAREHDLDEREVLEKVINQKSWADFEKLGGNAEIAQKRLDAWVEKEKA